MEESAEAAGSEQTHFHLKMGGAEIKFVGAAATLKDTVIPVANKVINLVDSHASLQRSNDAPLQIEVDTGAPDTLDVKPVHQEKRPASQFAHSTNTIAVHLKAETGSDLARAASAHLGIVKGKSNFSRKEILDEMKTATGFYKSSMNNNLSNALTRLTKEEHLHLVGQDMYALPNGEKATLEQLLAQIK